MDDTMSFATKLDKLSMVMRHPSLLKEKQNYIFILSHMRSRSSLLSHLLGNHPEICGYSELHYDYPKSSSLLKLHLELYKDLKDIKNSRFYLDKILHNSFVIADEILSKPNVHLLILYRDPEATVKSIVKMGEVTGKSEYLDTEQMLRYYIDRMSYLIEVSKKYDNIHIVESEEIVENTPQVLKELANWLNLGSDISETYRSFNKTGKPGHGDPSSNISTGKIIKTQNKQTVEFNNDLLVIANELYIKLKQTQASYVSQP